MNERLIDTYDSLLLDLDGVVYVGPDPVQGAVAAIGAATSRGVSVVYVTNNANRPAQQVAEHLTSFGLEVTQDNVVTSAQVAAKLVRDTLGPAATVLPIGGPGVGLAMRGLGLTVVESADDGPDAVVQGYGPDVGWHDLAEAAYACHRGARYVATNTDLTIPTARGIAPGNGALVAAVRTAIDQEPLVAGKPEPTAFWTASASVGSDRPLVVGDRLDTDIAGGNAAGYDTLLVLTGVHGTDEVLAAETGFRPKLIAADLAALHEPLLPVRLDGDSASCGSSRVTLVAGEIIRADDERHPDPVALLRAASALLWKQRDAFTEIESAVALSQRLRRVLP